MSKKVDNIKQFWIELESKLGEKILDKTLARFIEKKESHDVEIWGLFFSTSKHYYFKTFPQDNWFSSMLSNKNKSSEQESLEFAIPKEAIQYSKIISPGSFWKRLLSSPVPIVELKYLTADGHEKTTRFILENNIIS